MKKENTSLSEGKSETKGIGAIIMQIMPGAGTDDITIDAIAGDDPPPLVTETAEEKAAREAADKKKLEEKEADDKFRQDFIKSAGGVSIEEKDGVLNVLDATGKILKSVKKDGTPVESEGDAAAVTIDDVTYKLDKDGNALSADGKIFKTKAELEALEADDNVAVIDEVITKAGIKPVDPTTGKPKVYEDTVDGILEFANDLAEIKNKEEQVRFFKAYPRVQQLAEHLKAGGTEETFFKNVVLNDYTKVTIDPNNPEQQKQLLKEYFIKKGIAPEKAAALVKRSEDANALPTDSQDALVEMQADQKAREAKEKQERIDAEKKAEEDNIKYWNGIKTIVDKGTVFNAMIPDAMKIPFYEYMSKAVTDEGYSQAMLDAQAESEETKIFIEFLRYNKYDLSKIVKSAIAREKIKTLTTRLKRQKIEATEIKPDEKADIGEIDISTIS